MQFATRSLLRNLISPNPNLLNETTTYSRQNPNLHVTRGNRRRRRVPKPRVLTIRYVHGEARRHPPRPFRLTVNSERRRKRPKCITSGSASDVRANGRRGRRRQKRSLIVHRLRRLRLNLVKGCVPNRVDSDRLELVTRNGSEVGAYTCVSSVPPTYQPRLPDRRIVHQCTTGTRVGIRWQPECVVDTERAVSTKPPLACLHAVAGRRLPRTCVGTRASSRGKYKVVNGPPQNSFPHAVTPPDSTRIRVRRRGKVLCLRLTIERCRRYFLRQLLSN